MVVVVVGQWVMEFGGANVAKKWGEEINKKKEVNE